MKTNKTNPSNVEINNKKEEMDTDQQNTKLTKLLFPAL